MTRAGYIPCRCRDCFEITISNDVSVPKFCWECEDTGCDADKECQAPGAYGVCDEDDERQHSA